MLYFSNKNKKILSVLFLVFFVFLSLSSSIPVQGQGGFDPIPNDLIPGAGVTDTIDDNAYNPNILPAADPQTGNQANTTVDTDTTYTPLAPLSDELSGPYQTTGKCPLTRYLNVLFNIFLGLAAVLAMVMIFVGGIEYMGSELISSKEAGMSKVKNAIGGLLLALAAYLILYTINPRLLNVCLDIPNATITVAPPPGDSSAAPFSPMSQAELQNLGIECPGSGGKDKLVDIAKSFQGKVKYSNDPRNVIQGGTVLIDCSSFVKQVYACAGMDFNGDRTATMFGGQGQVSVVGTKVNGEELKVGDLLGWTMGESGPGQGHVVMYIGGGKFIEMTGSGILIRSLESYAGRYKHVIKVY
ncbi:MAG: C40 family peptidase [bacterium]|nr:C40 family peptidase [bacterium]